MPLGKGVIGKVEEWDEEWGDGGETLPATWMSEISFMFSMIYLHFHYPTHALLSLAVVHAG